MLKAILLFRKIRFLLPNQPVMKKLNSSIFQEVLDHLIDEGHKITSEAQAWSNQNAPSVYFNTRLNTDALIAQFDVGKI